MNFFKRTLNDETKNLMLRVTDDNSSLIPIMHQISHYRYRNNILRWLIHNRIIGNNLLEWLKIDHDNSVMGMVRFIIKSNNKDKEFKTIIMHRDWIK